MDLQKEKLILLPLHCGNAGGAFIPLQKLTLFGVVTKLTMFSDMLCKNMFLKEDVNAFEARLTPEQRLMGLNQYATSSRSRYILTGALTPRIDMTQKLLSLRFSFRLYDNTENRMLFDVSYTVHDFEEGMNTAQKCAIPAPDMNAMLNWVASLILTCLYPDRIHLSLPYLSRHYLTATPELLKLLILVEEQGDYDAKIETLEAATRLDPKLEYGYSQLGKICRLAGYLEKSIAYYQKALQFSQSSDQTKAHYATEMGIAFALMGNQDHATNCWLKAIELAPRYTNPYMNVAITYEEKNDLDNAEEYYLKAQAIEPQDHRTYYGLGALYQKRQEWKKAIQQYQHYLNLDDRDPWCHNEMATCYLQMGDQANAAVHLERTSALDPDGECGQFAKLILSNLSHV